MGRYRHVDCEVITTIGRPKSHGHRQTLLAKAASRRSAILPGVLAGVAGIGCSDARSEVLELAARLNAWE